MHKKTYRNTYTHIHTQYVHIYIYTHTYIHVYTRMHTNIHKQITRIEWHGALFVTPKTINPAHLHHMPELSHIQTYKCLCRQCTQSDIHRGPCARVHTHTHTHIHTHTQMSTFWNWVENKLTEVETKPNFWVNILLPFWFMLQDGLHQLRWLWSHMVDSILVGSSEKMPAIHMVCSILVMSMYNKFRA